MYANGSLTFTDRADVTFKTLGNLEIDHYINNGKPFDKAGAYGIQEWIGLIAVERIEGSYFTVMGLPTHLVWQELLKGGFIS
jgi:septum formation protein